MRFESSFLGCEDNTDPKFKSGEINEMTPTPPDPPGMIVYSILMNMKILQNH